MVTVTAPPRASRVGTTGGGNPRPLLRRKLRRDLRSSRWQAIAVLVTVTLGVLLFAASFDAFRNLTASYEKTYDDLAFADLTISGGEQVAIARAASATDGVAQVDRRVQADVPVRLPRPDGTEHTMVGRLVGLPAPEQPSVNRVDVLTGDYLGPGDTDGVLVERHMSDHFDLQPGDTLTVLLADGPADVTVRGTVASAEYLWPAQDRQSLFSLPDEFGVMFAAEGLVARTPGSVQVDQTLVTYGPEGDAPALDAHLTSVARDANAADIVRQDDQASNAALSEDLGAFGALSFMFPALFLTAAGFATFIILNRLVASQRGQIGVLIATGMTRHQVLRHYLGFGLALGLTGAVLGLALGVPAGAAITSTYTGLLSIPDTVVAFSWVTPVVGLVFGLLMGLLSAWAPARSAVRVPPAQAMRGELPEHDGAGPSAIERVVPAAARLPVRYRVGLRGIGRHRTRSAATVGGVALALVLVLVSWGMIDTVDRLITKQFEVVALQDAQVYLQVPVDETAVADLEATDGVAAAETVVSLEATVVTADDQYATEVRGYATDTEMHGFVAPDGQSLDLPASGVLVGQATRDVLGLAPADPVVLRLPSLDVEVDTIVAGFVDEPLGTYAYAEREWLTDIIVDAGVPASEIATPALSSVLVAVDESADPATVLATLEDRPDVAAAVSTTALRDLFEQYLALFYAFIGVMLVLGGILAFALIFTMITATLAERSAELATLRASGLSVRQVNQMTTVENVLLTLIGIPLGLVLGYVTASMFMASFSSDLFSFDLDMNPWTLLWTSVAVVAVALLSQVPGRRAIRRLDIATVVRQRSL